jgi:hypothetical protein
MKSWIATAGAIVLCAFLAYRVVRLEGRIDELMTQVQDAEVPAADHGRRIEALANELTRMRQELSLVERQTRGKVDVEDLDDSVSEDRILSVVTSEAERIRDRQLEFQRDRWVEHRDQALDDFVRRHGVAAQQAQRLRELVTEEIDSLTELLKTKDALDNPEQAASDWAAILSDTDRQVASLLTAEQLASWQQARLLERKVLWPWLPDRLE